MIQGTQFNVLFFPELLGSCFEQFKTTSIGQRCSLFATQTFTFPICEIYSFVKFKNMQNHDSSLLKIRLFAQGLVSHQKVKHEPPLKEGVCY